MICVLSNGRPRWLRAIKKLWKILIDKDIKKKDLGEQAHISHYIINKLNHGANVTMDTLERICQVFDCSMDDIMEFV